MLLMCWLREALNDVDVEDLDVLLWLLFVSSGIFDLMDHIKTLHRSPEDGVLAI